MLFFNRAPVVPVLRFSGPIGMVTPLRPGLALASVAGPIEKAFALSKLPTVAIVINSPGGSPVQSHLIFSRIRQLAKEKEKRVYVFCEDIAASGGYFLALAGDEIYADPSSIVGSIGVISAELRPRQVHRALRHRAARLHLRQGQGCARSLPAGAAGGRGAAEGPAARRSRDIYRHRQGAAGRQAQGAGRRAVLRRVLVGGQGAGLRPDRRHRRPAQQDAGAARRQGAAESRTPGSRAGCCRVFAVFRVFNWLRTTDLRLAPSLADDLVSAIEARALWSRYRSVDRGGGRARRCKSPWR